MVTKGQTIENKRTGQRMTFLKTWKETNGTQLQIECFSPTSKTKEPEHIHPYQENRFTMLSGQLVFCINGKERIARAGDVVSVPKNVPHYFWNEKKEEAHYIQEFFPALNIDSLFETFFALERDRKLSKQGKPNLLRTSVIMLEHQNDIRITKPGWKVQKTVYKLLAPVGRLLGYKPIYN